MPYRTPERCLHDKIVERPHIQWMGNWGTLYPDRECLRCGFKETLNLGYSPNRKTSYSVLTKAPVRVETVPGCFRIECCGAAASPARSKDLNDIIAAIGDDPTLSVEEIERRINECPSI